MKSLRRIAQRTFPLPRMTDILAMAGCQANIKAFLRSWFAEFLAADVAHRITVQPDDCLIVANGASAKILAERFVDEISITVVGIDVAA